MDLIILSFDDYFSIRALIFSKVRVENIRSKIQQIVKIKLSGSNQTPQQTLQTKLNNNQKMGNKLQLPLILSNFQPPNSNHSYEKLKQKTNLINSAFKQTHQKLMLNLELIPASIRYQQMNWKKSTVRGTLAVKKPQILILSEQRPSLWNKDEILLSYEDVNMLFDQMKNFNKPNTNTPSAPAQTLSATSHPIPTTTPQTSTVSQPEQCCICLQNTPSMVLPCSHAFCDNCTVKYIIEADEKKCPQCRQQMKGSRESVEKQIFTVVQDNEVYQQVRFDVLQVLRNMNPRVVKNFQEFLKSN